MILFIFYKSTKVFYLIYCNLNFYDPKKKHYIENEDNFINSTNLK